MKVMIILMVFLSISLFTSGQISQSERFAGIPAEHRPKLKEKLEQFINHYQARDWGAVYDCLCKPTKSREKFIESFREFNWLRGQLVEFNPVYHAPFRDTPEFADAAYLLTGCARFTEGENYRYSLKAYLIKGNWCFDTMFPTELIEGMPSGPCKMSDNLPVANHKN